MKKWIVLLVILILVVPYQAKTKPGYGHPNCIGRQNSTEVHMKALIYSFYSDKICSGVIHYSFAFPAGEPRYFLVVFSWTAIRDGNGHYEFRIFDYRIPNETKLIFWWPRLK